MIMMDLVQPPTSRLPPIAKIATFANTSLFESLEYLHSLYHPQVRASRRRRREEPLSHSDDLRSDTFERAYAIRWLTALIAQLEARQEQSLPAHTIPDPAQLQFLSSESNYVPVDSDTLIEQAASLLAICAGVAAAGKVQRRFSFESTLVGQIHVVLTDIPLDNHDYGSVGAQTWGGACVLAEMIAEHPDRFGLAYPSTRWTRDDLDTSNHARTRPLCVLELGAGTGLVGLTVAKLLQAIPLTSKNPNIYPTLDRRATVTLTDFYPSVLDNLQSNIDINFPNLTDGDADHTLSISTHPLDWSLFPTIDMIPDVLATPFDIVFGADIVYEAQHAVWIRDCLKSLLSYPDGLNEDPVFHLVIPLRPTHTFESSTIEEVFPLKDRALEGSRELVILSKESIFCEAHTDGERSHADDDVEYVYYQIGWTR